jgi:hypothetical protein
MEGIRNTQTQKPARRSRAIFFVLNNLKAMHPSAVRIFNFDRRTHRRELYSVLIFIRGIDIYATIICVVLRFGRATFTCRALPLFLLLWSSWGLRILFCETVLLAAMS